MRRGTTHGNRWEVEALEDVSPTSSMISPNEGLRQSRAPVAFAVPWECGEIGPTVRDSDYSTRQLVETLTKSRDAGRSTLSF